ncbi:MAG: NADH-quinone oxidoreductase subunit N [Bacteroidales bacterium]|jgi:NADH-quinone oxidoreductase subunit N|nr:NADH-quinone oxidoreductase subunit N [Bacteroidales bacterium]
MDLSNFLLMRHEISLVALFVLLLGYDLFASDNAKKHFQLVACLLFAVHTLVGFCPAATGEVFGGMYVTNNMHLLVKNILNIGVLLVFLQTNAWLQTPNTVVKRGEFFMLTIFTLFGMYLMISSGHFLLFYIGLETASIPLATLAAFDKYRHNSAEAGAKYVLMAAFSSGVMLFGISLLYGATGALYFSDIAPKIVSNPMTILGMVFFLAGMFFKISLVPFHLWTADVYEGAPTPVTAYLSVVSKGAAVFVLSILAFHVFTNLAVEWKLIFQWIIVITITAGNLFAVRQNNIKRFLAFSSISQAGYIVLGVLAGSAFGMATIVYYILAYLFSNIAAFGVIASIEAKTGKLNISDYNGLYQTNPKLSLTLVLALFSLGGIPIFVGFFSKFFIFFAAAEAGYYVIVFIALLNTIISLYYYLLPIKAMLINKNDSPIEAFKTDGYNRISLTLCVIGIVLVGLISPIFHYIEKLSAGM